MKKMVFILSLLMLLSFLLHVRFNPVEVKAPDSYPVHNLDSGLNYTTIQSAIDDPETLNGHTIFAEEGIYYENVVVNKTVSLLGEDRDATIVDGNGTGDVVMVVASSVTIINFTIRNSGEDVFDIGLFLHHSFNGTISSNNVHSNGIGIQLSWCNNITVTHNNVSYNEWGIGLVSSNNSVFIGNSVHSNYDYGIMLQSSSSNNTIVGNDIHSNGGWYDLETLEQVWTGIAVWGCSDNRIFHNNIVNNAAEVIWARNYWDDGYPSGGNYWSDYNGTDLFTGPYQNETGSDGIGDVPYVIHGYPQDYQDCYPLMGMFYSFNTTLGKHVNVISNSTIDDLEYFEANSTIKMYVSNMTSNQTFGFCRICIPKHLIAPNYTVTINRVEPYYVNYTLYDNGTHRWIYFSYEHSTIEIIIVPEFSSFLILPLFKITTLLAVIFYRRKLTR